jgi:hypothetical protein
VSARGVLPAVVAAGLVAFVAVACGSPKQAAPAVSKQKPRLTQKRFVAAADQVCVNSDRRIYRLGTLSTAPAGWAKTVVAADAGLARMAALRPPLPDAVGFAKLLRLGGRLRDNVQRVRLALVRKDLKAARQAQLAAKKLGGLIHAQAKTLGLTFCEQPATNWPA